MEGEVFSRRTFFSAAAASVCAAQQLRRPPNIVIILADDLGAGECGFQGMRRDIPTPNIDSIAANGVRFTQGYVSAPYCTPSRAGLLTGRYQTRFGHEMNVVGSRNNSPGMGLPLSEKTIADSTQGGRLLDRLYRQMALGRAARVSSAAPWLR
jgi:Sulfatase